jgi:hypothetical protein
VVEALGGSVSYRLSLPTMAKIVDLVHSYRLVVKRSLIGRNSSILFPPWTLSTAHGSGNRALLVPGYSD